jgi:large exoprotein involved in heme utilization and adhesion
LQVVFQDCLDWSNSLEVLLLHDFPSVLAQSITPASDGTGSIVIKDSNQYNIPGSIISKDGTKLFQSFQQFELNSDQIANFLSY